MFVNRILLFLFVPREEIEGKAWIKFKFVFEILQHSY